MEREIDLAPGSAAADVASGSIYFIGNATVLIRYGGFTVLTDPTFIHMHEQVSIGYGMHSTRLTNPAMEIQDLPPLDLLLLSHFHGDHFDQVAEQELDKSLPIVTTPEAAKALNERGFPIPIRSRPGPPSKSERAMFRSGSPRCPGGMVRLSSIWRCRRSWEACSNFPPIGRTHSRSTLRETLS